MASTSDEDNTTRRTTDDFTTGLGQSGGGDGADDSQRPVIESWVASTQNWMNARFADWDTRNPQTADYVIVSDFYDVERLAPRPARSSLPPLPRSRRTGPARRSHRPRLFPASRHCYKTPGPPQCDRCLSYGRGQSFEPIWVDEKLNLGIAYELNFKNEGIGVVPPQVVRKPAATVRFDPIPVVRKVYREVQLELAQWSRTLGSVLPRVVFPASSPRRFEPVVVAKNPRGGVAEKLIQLSQGIGINPAMASAPRPAVPSARPAVTSPRGLPWPQNRALGRWKPARAFTLPVS